MNETQGKGEKKTWLIMLIILVLALTASNVITYISLQSVQQQYNDLSSLYSNLKSNYNELSNSYSSLKSSYDKLSQDYQDLQLQYSSLQSNYSSLSSNYNKLNNSYSSLKSDYNKLSQLLQSCDCSSYFSFFYKELSQNVLSLYDLLLSYAFLEQAFSRTLNEEAVNEVSSTVNSVTGGSTSFWPSVEKIYDYITSNVKYANDVDMPYLWLICDGFNYITSFEILTERNYVQTPELTLEIKQGDCEDQAILTYAMIEYYMKHIIGTECNLYIACMDFSDGSAHTAVFLPVQGGNVCIIDPAGSYLTKEYGEIVTKPAQQELQAYSNYLSSYGSISSIKLYDVSIVDGSYKVVAEGGIS